MNIALFILRRAAAALLLIAAGGAQAAIPATQRQYLLDFHAATSGAGWTNSTGWGGAPGTECTWFGVYCDAAETTVTRLEVSSNNLVSPVGTPLPDWSALPDLQWLTMSNNTLTGPVPAIASLTQLSVFNLSDNNFTGALPDPSGLPVLERYQLYGNQFTGAIPALTGLPTLTQFLVWNNQLPGGIPDLSGMPALEYFSVRINQLTGPLRALPAGLLRILVDTNQLTGALPAPPAGLLPNASMLCPNLLIPAPNVAWDAAATGATPWYDGCSGVAPGATAIPTLSEWALVLMSALAAAMGLAALRRKLS